LKNNPGVRMNKRDIETLKDAKAYVFEQEDSIKSLINPSDLFHQDLESWDNADIDRLRDELAGSMGEAWTYGINHPYGDIIRDIAVNQYVDDMVRIPRDHLVFGNNPEKCVQEGYWLHEWSRDFVTELVYENMENIEFFHEYEDNVRMEIEASILEARLKDF
jgi:hypothetical protein